VNSGHSLFFRASASFSKIRKDKEYFNTEKVQDNSVFQDKRKLFKILNDKKINTVNSGQTQVAQKS